MGDMFSRRAARELIGCDVMFTSFLIGRKETRRGHVLFAMFVEVFLPRDALSTKIIQLTLL